MTIYDPIPANGSTVYEGDNVNASGSGIIYISQATTYGDIYGLYANTPHQFNPGNGCTISAKVNSGITAIVMHDFADPNTLVWYHYPGVHPAPVADFSGTPTSGAVELDVQFTDESTGTPTSWDWDFGDETDHSTAQNPLHTYTVAGTYTVTLTATNAYGSDVKIKTNYITALYTPVASFYGTPTTGTGPLTVQFTDTSSHTPTSWLWDFGGGVTSTEQNPLVTYAGAGSYSVTLTATNATGPSEPVTATDYIVVTTNPVYGVPTARASRTPASGAAPVTVQFTDLSTGSPTSWFWNFGDGGSSTNQNPSHQYTMAGSFDVSLQVSNGNGSDTVTYTEWVTVTKTGAPAASFSGTPLSGAATLSVTFTDASTNTPTSWLWNFGDGGTSTSQNPTHNYAYKGSYTVSLTATNASGSGMSTLRNYIVVTSGTGPTLSPVACFTPNTPVYVQAGDQTSGGTGTGYVTFDASCSTGATPLTYEWQFPGSDGLHFLGVNPTVFYTQVSVDDTHPTRGWPVTLTVTNANGSNTKTINNLVISRLPPIPLVPIADFSGTPLSGAVPLTVVFTDASTVSPTSWLWSFGDGGTSTDQNPTHIYVTAGTYTVSLTATNAHGSNKMTKTNYIVAGSGGGGSGFAVGAKVMMIPTAGGVRAVPVMSASPAE